MSPILLRKRLDTQINKLCEIRNTTSQHYDVDFEVNDELAAVEVAIEALAQSVDQEIEDL
jgi:hypothetical protein